MNPGSTFGTMFASDTNASPLLYHLADFLGLTEIAPDAKSSTEVPSGPNLGRALGPEMEMSTSRRVFCGWDSVRLRPVSGPRVG